MHAVVMDSLEEYLSGAIEPAAQRAVEAHLAGCAACREDVRTVQEVSSLFGSMRSGEVFEPSPSFAASVMQNVSSLKPEPTFASLFAVDLAFGRRLAFASLVLLAVLGSF